MKSNQSRTTKVFVKLLNVRSWFDWERTQETFLYLLQSSKKLFLIKQSTADESFDEALRKYNLTANDLSNKAKSLFRLFLFMMVLISFLFAYASYHLIAGHFNAFIMSVSLMMVAVSLAFRYHFWYTQIKTRQLGLSFSEWVQKGLMGKHDE